MVQWVNFEVVEAGSTLSKGESNPSSILPWHMHVIDVRNMRLIPAPEACRFVAMSYIWGESERIVASEENLRS